MDFAGVRVIDQSPARPEAPHGRGHSCGNHQARKDASAHEQQHRRISFESGRRDGTTKRRYVRQKNPATEVHCRRDAACSRFHDQGLKFGAGPHRPLSFCFSVPISYLLPPCPPRRRRTSVRTGRPTDAMYPWVACEAANLPIPPTKNRIASSARATSGIGPRARIEVAVMIAPEGS